MSNFCWWLLSVCAGYTVFCIVHSFAAGGIHDARFLNACNYLCDYIKDNTKEGSAPCVVQVIYKNKLFNVCILFERTNSRYGLYRIFINGEEAAKYHVLLQYLGINGEEAAKYHVLLQYLGGRSCTLEPVNGRDQNEVERIVFATRKMLEKQENPKTVPESKAKSYFN